MKKNEKFKYNLTSKIYQFFWTSVKRISMVENFKLTD